jgi:hypothetical protein
MNMFKPDAPWQNAASHIQVFTSPSDRTGKAPCWNITPASGMRWASRSIF